MVPESVYVAFDKRLLPAMDFLTGAGNVVDSTGGRGEIELMTRLGKPSLPSLRETLEWRAGRKHMTYSYAGLAEEPLFDEGGRSLKIAVLDGPYWTEGATGSDLPQVQTNIDAARRDRALERGRRLLHSADERQLFPERRIPRAGPNLRLHDPRDPTARG